MKLCLRPGAKSKANKRVGTPGEELVDQSVFPVRTPDKEGWLGPLSDLLEEEITLPGESRQVRRIIKTGQDDGFISLDGPSKGMRKLGQ